MFTYNSGFLLFILPIKLLVIDSLKKVHEGGNLWFFHFLPYLFVSWRGGKQKKAKNGPKNDESRLIKRQIQNQRLLFNLLLFPFGFDNLWTFYFPEIDADKKRWFPFKVALLLQKKWYWLYLGTSFAMSHLPWRTPSFFSVSIKRASALTTWQCRSLTFGC